MVFDFQNIGIVKSATIELNGLTVITGVNDTGKSFLSKMIYGIIRTITFSDTQIFSRQINNFDSKILALTKFLNDLPVDIKNADIFFSILPYLNKQRELSDVLDKHRAIIRGQIEEHTELPASTFEEFDRLFHNIVESSVSSIPTKEEMEKTMINNFNILIINQLFRGKINSLIDPKSISKVRCTINNQNALEIEIRENSATRFELNLPAAAFHREVTLIDTPVILQLAYFIRQQRVKPYANSDISTIPSYYLDLLSKLPSSAYSGVDEGHQELVSEIQKIIGGTMLFKEDTDSFVFQKNDGISVDMFNTASGIKSFGIIQMLLNGGHINSRSILIVDEPEVHLHPSWQLAYAQIVALLTKSGIKIVLSSHSSYFLEALTFYIKEYEIYDKVKFYYGESLRQSTCSGFVDVTDNLDPIFEKLAMSLRSLYLRK